MTEIEGTWSAEYDLNEGSRPTQYDPGERANVTLDTLFLRVGEEMCALTLTKEQEEKIGEMILCYLNEQTINAQRDRGDDLYDYKKEN